MMLGGQPDLYVYRLICYFYFRRGRQFLTNLCWCSQCTLHSFKNQHRDYPVQKKNVSENKALQYIGQQW